MSLTEKVTTEISSEITVHNIHFTEILHQIHCDWHCNLTYKTLILNILLAVTIFHVLNDVYITM